LSSAKLALAVIVFGGLTVVAADIFGWFDLHDGEVARLVALAAVGIWVSAGVVGQYRGQFGRALPHLALWVAIVTAIAALYVWGEPIKALLGIAPDRAHHNERAPAGEPGPRRYDI
jgi:predicted aspartyl protease